MTCHTERTHWNGDSKFSGKIGTEMSFTSNGETKKYNNIRKIKYSTTEQKT